MEVIQQPKPLVYRGNKEICAAIGLNWKKMAFYVRELKLPAFKVEPEGQWLARPEDLERWLEDRKNGFAGQDNS